MKSFLSVLFLSLSLGLQSFAAAPCAPPSCHEHEEILVHVDEVHESDCDHVTDSELNVKNSDADHSNSKHSHASSHNCRTLCCSINIHTAMVFIFQPKQEIFTLNVSDETELHQFSNSIYRPPIV